MKGPLRKARAITGIAAGLVLLGLFVAESLGHGSISTERVLMLLALIGTLLGVDIIGEYFPIGITIRLDDERESLKERHESMETDGPDDTNDRTND